MLFSFPGRRGEFPRVRAEEAKLVGSASLDVQPQVGPNGHFVSSVYKCFVSQLREGTHRDETCWPKQKMRKARPKTERNVYTIMAVTV